jgi:hypothetical protein
MLAGALYAAKNTFLDEGGCAYSGSLFFDIFPIGCYCLRELKTMESSNSRINMNKTTEDLASEINFSITYAINAHIKNPKSPQDSIRFWDKTTPYVVHPIWCGMTLITETRLPEEVRFWGYQALLWHDLLEDTNLPLPEGTDSEVIRLVQEMTHPSFREEQLSIWDQREVVKLLKLYDKVSNLLDAVWMKDAKWNNLVEYTLKLRQFDLETYGDLNIVKIAGAVCLPRKIQS